MKDEFAIENAKEIYAALLPFAQAFHDALENGEGWFGALDRIGEDEFQTAHNNVQALDLFDDD